MEELKELEEVQNVMLMMPAIDSSSPSADSKRFLANFTLFMMQPCGELDMNQKCTLISDHFPKISSAFLEEALCQLCDKGEYTFFAGNACIAADSRCDGDKSVQLPTDSEDVAMVALDSMQRANSTLEDFCRSYFMFHEMDANSAESIFKYLPLLSFTESYMYQLDTINENLVQFPISDFTFRKLAALLEGYGMYTDRIRNELKCGEEYWALERKLCCALTRKQEEIQVEDVMKAIHLKSFDYRVLNLLLYQLNGKEVNETHMEFLSVSEFLVEISDDLFDYEDDVLENNFNILRMFVRIYGASSAPTLLAKSITEAEEKYSYLLSALDPQLALTYKRRCEEATKEGGKVVGPPLGTWCIPPIIEDEDLYRYEISNTRPPGTS
ncbi:uncharacterized protein LOC110909014 isoform X1 [Helianthus annuus]|uniref:uncharacterized protein LOC110909014 isoform X1 n=1 Tax=Helianthus annuus TaxID=4232 RepID=UPI000B908CB1|nr:uncharacterized protein LOC110909014 isoform X1 [Helianthus annuus]